MKKLNWNIKIGNELWPVTDSQSREPEDMNFSDPYSDTELKRTNPKRYDKRHDWYQSLNEKAKDTDISGRYEQTSLTSGASIKKVLNKKFNKEEIKMKDWRFKLGATNNITKKDIDVDYDFKNFKTENKVELPNRAKFTGDKVNTSGNPAKREVDTWKNQNKEYEKAKKKEDKPEYGSPALLEKRYEDLDDKINDDNVIPEIMGGYIKHSWLEVLSDVNVTKQPDGKLVINVEENQMMPSQTQIPENTQQPPQEEPQPKEASKVKEWEIKKVGNLSLIGKECATHCGIGIYRNSRLGISSRKEEVKFYKEARNGHQWNEIINQGKWETDFDEIVNAK